MNWVCREVFILHFQMSIQKTINEAECLDNTGPITNPPDKVGLFVSFLYSVWHCCRSFTLPYISHGNMDVKNVQRVLNKISCGHNSSEGNVSK